MDGLGLVLSLIELNESVTTRPLKLVQGQKSQNPKPQPRLNNPKLQKLIHLRRIVLELQL